MSETPVWHGVLVANPVILSDTLEIDFDAHGAHGAWLAAEGCDGITPNGSLGEYATLTAEERTRIVSTAFAACRAGDLARALPLYRALHPLLRWDYKTEFVQAIKLSMEIVGRGGGPCRPRRLPLTPTRTLRCAP